EQQSRVAAALRRFAPQTRPWIVETRSPRLLQEALAQHPASLVVWHVAPDDAVPMLQAWSELETAHASTRCVVYCPGGEPALVDALREAGIVYVAVSLLQLRVVGRLWRKHAALFPPQSTGLRDAMRRRLPWSAPAEDPAEEIESATNPTNERL
ncbi:MAG: hypothetical protein KDA41_10130, partial [Planctomycetales bacterium]|nr:hypothetical protein [Planctomycetales bacterium]